MFKCQQITCRWQQFGRFPLFIGRQVRIIQYWLNLCHSKAENCILWTLNNIGRSEVETGITSNSWTEKIKSLLERSGFFFMYGYSQSVNTTVLYQFFKQG